MTPSTRDARPYQHIVVKVGTNLLTAGADRLSRERMVGIVDQIAQLHAQGRELLLVTSGAIAAGREALGAKTKRRDIPFRQVLASVGQGRLMRLYEELFAQHGVVVAQALVTRSDLSDRLGYLNVRNTLQALLDYRVVPIINENDVVAVEEIGGEVFGDNDNLSAMIANLVDADLLAILTDIDGLYTADPRANPKAKLVPRVERITTEIEAMAGKAGSARGTGGMSTKIEAAKLATASGIPVVIASGVHPDALLRVAAGEQVGTLFTAVYSRVESRKRWMLSRPASKGTVIVDAGAAKALEAKHVSLLPVGIVDVKGDFQRGDVIFVETSAGKTVACGIANYSASDARALRGLRSDRIQEKLGYEYGEEVVHRNNLVLL